MPNSRFRLYLALLVTLSFVSEAASAELEHPNIVLIVADDLGYGDLSCYGQDAYQTPNIDTLAKQGVRATDFYVPVPYCAPSRAALLTGRLPLRTGMILNPHPDTTPEADAVGLNPDEITLPEMFKAKGYSTTAIGKWHLGHQPEFLPTRQGFDFYYGILYSNDMLPIQIMKNEEVAVNPVDQRDLTVDYTKQAVEFINEQKGDPFFLYLPHAMPHKPLAVSGLHYTPDTPDDLYADVIREMDWSVGQVVDALKANGILDQTIVIFMSDNGPFYGGSTGGFRGQKATSWEGGTRVPFIIRYPGVLPEDKTISTPIWSLDIFPTLLSLSHISPPKDTKIDGENITAILQGKSKSHGPIITSHRDKVTTIRNGDWKLYISRPFTPSKRDVTKKWVDPKGPNGVTIIAQGREEQPGNDQYAGLFPPPEIDNPYPLYNLREDPAESIDRSEEHPEKVTELRKIHQRFLDSLIED